MFLYEVLQLANLLFVVLLKQTGSIYWKEKINTSKAIHCTTNTRLTI